MKITESVVYRIELRKRGKKWEWDGGTWAGEDPDGAVKALEDYRKAGVKARLIEDSIFTNSRIVPKAECKKILKGW